MTYNCKNVLLVLRKSSECDGGLLLLDIRYVVSFTNDLTRDDDFVLSCNLDSGQILTSVFPCDVCYFEG